MSVTLQRNIANNYQIVKLKNCIGVTVEGVCYVMDDVMTPSKAEVLARDRTLDVTIHGVKN